MAAKLRVEQVKDEKGMEGLLEMLQSNLLDEYIVWRAARALRDLVHSDEALRADCVAQLGDETILAGMDTFPESAVVQAQCIRLLGSLSYGNDSVRKR